MDTFQEKPVHSRLFDTAKSLHLLGFSIIISVSPADLGYIRATKASADRHEFTRRYTGESLEEVER